MQFNRELLTFPLPRLEGFCLCPVEAVLRIKHTIKHKPSDHLFKLKNGNSLTYRQFQERFCELLKKGGVPNYREYSSHSYRRGSTTFAFLSGIPCEVIHLLGNWRSNCFLSYIEFPLETRTAACELMKMRLQAMEASKLI